MKDERRIDWLCLSRMHYEKAQKRRGTTSSEKFEKWHWLCLFLWAKADIE